jgi:beta-galactosidase
MHVLASLQAVAHGSETVQYFQWRKSRGGYEKLHGAVVDHCGHENTRVFRDVTQVGDILSKLTPVLGTSVSPEVAVIYDWENSWAISTAVGPRRDKKDYFETCQSHYRTFWENGIPADVINVDCDFSRYKVLVAPMLYMVKDGVDSKIEEFVRAGGVFVTTYLSGIADENDLCFLSGFPGPLRRITGIWSEEIDCLYDDDVNHVSFLCDAEPDVVSRCLGETAEEDSIYKKKYEARVFCDLVHCETARPLAVYENDFYAGRPALTVNQYGKGKAYYITFRNNDEFLTDFYNILIEKLRREGTPLRRAIESDLPYGVTAQLRTDGEKSYVFVSNYDSSTKVVALDDNDYTDLLTGTVVNRTVELRPYAMIILERIGSK